MNTELQAKSNKALHILFAKRRAKTITFDEMVSMVLIFMYGTDAEFINGNAMYRAINGMFLDYDIPVMTRAEFEEIMIYIQQEKWAVKV